MSGESISVIHMGDILLVSVPSDPDDQTISALQEKILNAMVRFEAVGLVLDISTVDSMDSYFARTIEETGQMVQLMGGVTAISGMQASVAVTATQLGLTLDSVLTALDVDRAVELIRNDCRRRRLS